MKTSKVETTTPHIPNNCCCDYNKFMRLTAIALGILALVIGALALGGVGSLSQVGRGSGIVLIVFSAISFGISFYIAEDEEKRPIQKNSGFNGDDFSSVIYSQWPIVQMRQIDIAICGKTKEGNTFTPLFAQIKADLNTPKNRMDVRIELNRLLKTFPAETVDVECLFLVEDVRDRFHVIIANPEYNGGDGIKKEKLEMVLKLQSAKLKILPQNTGEMLLKKISS